MRDLSLEVSPGEVCGLIGPNRAGKTTTMRVMLDLIEPTYGEIELVILYDTGAAVAASGYV